MRMPFTSTTSGMTMQAVIKIQGESLSVKAFCSLQHAQAERVWCKEELPEECSLEKLTSFSGSRWKGLTTQPDQRVIVNDLGDGCIYVFMSALQSEDTGIYWFGVLDGPNIIPLRNIRVIVQKAFPDLFFYSSEVFWFTVEYLAWLSVGDLFLSLR
uniref:Immunoglobulin V-set domain-containing protein n=1 Tax=Pseudonaja textilis TaxID=8673 RepID=A0A670ZGS3_PSETE